MLFPFFPCQILWHQCLTHPSEIVRTNLMSNLGTNSIACDTCHLLKFNRLLFMPSLSRANKIFELEYYDVWGPIIESFDGYKYLVTFIDDFSHRKVICLPHSNVNII